VCACKHVYVLYAFYIIAMCKLGDPPVIYMFFSLFRPVENPADDVLCVEIWYVLSSILLFYSDETLVI
jgi:hypothetical protein